MTSSFRGFKVMMKYYFAPLEGITGYLYRQAHHAYYPGVDRYYTPFLVPKEKKQLSTKERNDILPEHNAGITVIPQVMTNDAEQFLRIAHVLWQEYGYQEVNLNLGCPSKTVVSKKRGSGFLTVPDRLEGFFDEVCGKLALDGIKLSVKTRIGKEDPQEFALLLGIFGKFPLSELILHPRVQADFYKNTPNLEAFSWAYQVQKDVKWELCYNGDVFGWESFAPLCEHFPELGAVMMGRGMLANPRLAEELKKQREYSGDKKKAEKTAVFKRFMNAKEEQEERKRRYEMYRLLLEGYQSVMAGENHVLFKMKELWMYMCLDFTEPKRYWKQMKKAQKLANFEAAVNALCQEQHLCESSICGKVL